ncbi:MAG: EAL domain-containing protein [Pseudomonadota bacterium]
MRFHSLESRIVTLFLILILTVQLAGFVATRVGIDDNARALISEELAVGERVFDRLLEQNAQKLAQGAQLLAKDYGFMSAIGANDRETLVSALSNHGARIGATHTAMVGIDRKIGAMTAGLSSSLEQSILQLVDKADQFGSATGVGIVNNLPYQIVMVPVKAPVTIGWVAMTFPIDQRLAKDMQALSSLQVSILTRGKSGTWVSGASTLPRPAASNLASRLQDIPDGISFLPKLMVSNDEVSARIIRLARDADNTTIVVLQRAIDEAIAPYRRLQLTLLILTGLGILVTVAISAFTAKRITGPLRDLSETAKRLGAGNYDEAIQIQSQRDDEIGELSKAFEVMRKDIANREVEIRKLAYRDPLTELPNRAQFSIYLNEAIEQSKAQNRSCHVLMMDLDRFKNVNDVLGHLFGDALLRQVAERLKAQVQDNNGMVARLGGDEFAVLLSNCHGNEARAVAARILKSLEQPISLEDQTVDLGAGIGIAGFPDHGPDAETLLSHAEVAMYVAKKSGNDAVVYEAMFDKGSQQSLSLLSELRSAIDKNEFRLYVQPKLSLDSGKVIGLEALVRWVHPENGMTFPDDFIPFSEQTGFIRTLTRWVLEQSTILCHDLASRDVHLKISVNISARDLLDQDLPAKFSEILARHQVAPSSFCLEITESAIMDDPVRAQNTLEGLHALGLELSIDDFGTGYSSLAYLKRLPVDELKIDKSFVMNMEKDADDAKIVRSTIDLGHNLGLRVVAEGIESEAAWNLLMKMGCDQGQGYFMSKPMPSDQLLGWIEQWRPPQELRRMENI